MKVLMWAKNEKALKSMILRLSLCGTGGIRTHVQTYAR